MQMYKYYHKTVPFVIRELFDDYMCSILTKQSACRQPLRFIVLSYITHQYEHLEENIMALAPSFNEV